MTIKISWSKYKTYEGPFFGGLYKFTLPQNPSEEDKWIEVITAAEGGCYDSINMYDRGIISVGLIQWIEAGQYNVSNMLGSIIEKRGPDFVLPYLEPALSLCNATFKKNSKNQWRFFFNDERGEVDSVKKTQDLFLGCDGNVGSWNDDVKNQAKLWASCIAKIWSSKEAREIQLLFTKARLYNFITLSAKSILFDSTPSTGWVGAIRAAYVSYAINMPAVANVQLQTAVKNCTAPKWSEEWCIAVLKQLTFGPKYNIYPIRYNSIRPILEKNWNIELPKNSTLLKQYEEKLRTNDIVTPKLEQTKVVIETSQDSQVQPTINSTSNEKSATLSSVNQVINHNITQEKDAKIQKNDNPYFRAFLSIFYKLFSIFSKNVKQ